MCRKIITDWLRHSDTPHLLMNGIPDQLSESVTWAQLDSDYYLELVPDPSGSLAMVP